MEREMISLIMRVSVEKNKTDHKYGWVGLRLVAGLVLDMSLSRPHQEGDIAVRI